MTSHRLIVLLALVLSIIGMTSQTSVAEPSVMNTNPVLEQEVKPGPKGRKKTHKLSLSSIGMITPAHVRMVEIALADEGKGARALGLPGVEWCGDAMNRWRKLAGLPVPASRRAIDQKTHAMSIPQPVVGAVRIKPRRGGHHADLVIGVSTTHVTVIGGNVSNRVTIREMPIAGGRYFLIES